jgi:hypothetical protein
MAIRSSTFWKIVVDSGNVSRYHRSVAIAGTIRFQITKVVVVQAIPLEIPSRGGHHRHGIDGISHRVPKGSGWDRHGISLGISYGTRGLSPLNAGIESKRGLFQPANAARTVGAEALGGKCLERG